MSFEKVEKRDGGKNQVGILRISIHIFSGVVSNIFLFSFLFGEDEPILTHIFQMGWFNHQLDIYIYPQTYIFRGFV